MHYILIVLDLNFKLKENEMITCIKRSKIVKKFLNLLFAVLIIIPIGCELDFIKNLYVFSDPDIINLNETYPLTIEPNGKNFFIFIAETESHTVTLTSLTTDVDIILFEYVPTDEYLDQIFLAVSDLIGTGDETIIETLSIGTEYLIIIEEMDGIIGDYNLQVR